MLCAALPFRHSLITSSRLPGNDCSLADCCDFSYCSIPQWWYHKRGESHRGRRRAMPKRIQARAAQDEQEENQVRKLARSHHAPADWKFHARMVVESWAGKTPNEIATELKCHPKTVRRHLARFNRQGISGLGMRSGSGRKPRLTERERSRILALVRQPPPGRLERRASSSSARDSKAQHSGVWT